MLQQPVVPARRAPRETRPWRMFPGRAASGAAALCMAGLVGAEGNVVATSVVSAAGETIVRVETTLRQPPEAVWPSFATEAGLRCWAAPVTRLDLRTGGRLQSHYDAKAAIGDPARSRCRSSTTSTPSSSRSASC